MRKQVYVPSSAAPALAALEDDLRSQGVSLSSWFCERVAEAVAKKPTAPRGGQAPK